MVIEKKDVQFFTVSEVKTSPNVVLHLRGLAMHSAMGISRVETYPDSKNYIVLVHMALVSSGMTGNFDFDINVPADVDCVLFGKGREIIWKRYP